MNRYLLEIGTEELPVSFLQSAPTELSDKIKTALTQEGLPTEKVAVYATPRRLAVMIDNLPEQQADREELIKGPPTRIALDADGKPTKAGEGFAKKAGVDINAMQKETIDGEEYLTLRQKVSGKAVQQLLADILPEIILSLSGSHFMVWGGYDIKFSRPIRWLMSLWNQQHLPLSIGPVKSGTTTRGHRLNGDDPITVSSADSYLETLWQHGNVMADQCQRRERIQEQLTAMADANNGFVPENPDLLETVALLVESPHVVMGGFQERFLEVPDAVITTVMTAHQKYFPLYDAKNKKLRPNFLTISNGNPSADDMIRKGNEKVITARLEDARFFFTEDQKIPLGDRLEKLKGVTFQKGLGSVFEKTQRLMSLSELVAKQLNLSKDEITLTRRAAELAKADLVTGMVFEFTELQGVMGQKYAALAGEPEPVSTAIYEHYLPRFMGDDVAKSNVGIAVSLADKIDTLVCVFAQENAKLPTGSKDPLALRRMAAGVLNTVIENKLPINLVESFYAAYQQLGKLATASWETTMARLHEFVMQRLKVNLLEQNIRHDVIDAVMSLTYPETNPLCDLVDALTRLEALKILITDSAALQKIEEPANRIGKILGDNYDPEVEIAALAKTKWVDPSEEALYKTLVTIKPVSDSDYAAYLTQLQSLAEPVALFFEKVMVNDNDQQVRKNRYNLLSVINRYYLRFADFSKLVIA